MIDQLVKKTTHNDRNKETFHSEAHQFAFTMP